jgi:TPR repeat protein
MSAFNISLLYRYGHGVKQDYIKSHEWLEKAQEMGYVGADYFFGYAYYKGQGVKQDYKKAFHYFENGAKSGSAASMYMLAICYYKGRGSERNSNQGRIWMEKAAALGLSRAIDLIARNDSKTYGQKKNLLRSAINSEVFNFIPSEHVQVINDLSNNTMEGLWQGCLIQYDWSGMEIEKETKLSLYIEKTGRQIDGVWTENDTLISRISATLADSVWVFDDITLYEQQRPLEMKAGSFRIEKKEGKEKR